MVVLKYLHWIFNSMFLLILYCCLYIATQRNNEMLLLTFWELSSCPLEEATCIVPSVSLYSQVILQGGLPSAEQ